MAEPVPATVRIVSFGAALRTLRESRAPGATRLDMIGILIATTGLVLLVYPLVEGQVAGWPLWTFVCMALSPVVLAVFVLYERSLAAERFPLVQLSLFRIRSFSAGIVIALAFLAAVPAFFFTFSLLLQVGLRFSALHSGLTTVPWSVASAFGSLLSMRLASRLGRYTITLGSTLMAAGILGIIASLHLAGVSVTSWDLIPAFLVAGAGMGTVMAPLLTVILAGVQSRHAGSASGVLTTFQQLGGAVGVGGVGVLFFALLQSNAPGAVGTVTAPLQTQLEQAHMPTPAAERLVTVFSRCFEERAASSDPQQATPGCPSASDGPTSNPVTDAVQRAAGTAIATDFVTTMESALFLNAAFCALTAILSLLLPRDRPSLAGTPALGG
jgi:hypothetical protein